MGWDKAITDAVEGRLEGVGGLLNPRLEAMIEKYVDQLEKDGIPPELLERLRHEDMAPEEMYLAAVDQAGIMGPSSADFCLNDLALSDGSSPWANWCDRAEEAARNWFIPEYVFEMILRRVRKSPKVRGELSARAREGMRTNGRGMLIIDMGHGKEAQMVKSNDITGLIDSCVWRDRQWLLMNMPSFSKEMAHKNEPYDPQLDLAVQMHLPNAEFLLGAFSRTKGQEFCSMQSLCHVETNSSNSS